MCRFHVLAPNGPYRHKPLRRTITTHLFYNCITFIPTSPVSHALSDPSKQRSKTPQRTSSESSTTPQSTTCNAEAVYYGKHTRKNTPPTGSLKVCKHSPDAADHTLAESSQEAVSTRSPSDENTAEHTYFS